MITQFIAALARSSLYLTSKEVAEVIWLAEQLAARSSVEATQTIADQELKDNRREIGGAEPHVDTALTSGKDLTPENSNHTPALAGDVTSDADLTDKAPPKSSDDQVDLFPHSGNSGDPDAANDGLALRVAGTTSITEPRRLARALRPLMIRVFSKVNYTVDERATAHLYAETGVMIPVMVPEQERWLDLVLVVDGASSMRLWSQTARELKDLLEHQGAFRNSELWTLDTQAAEPLLYRGGNMVGGQTRSPRELIDPARDRLILLVSDCVAPAWDDGRMARFLSLWSGSEMVVLLQVLPERLWERTGLNSAHPVHLSWSDRTGCNDCMRAKPAAPYWLKVDASGVTIPIVILSEDSFTCLATFVTAQPKASCLGYNIPATASPAAEDGSYKAANEVTSAVARLRRFQASASPTAQKLAHYLAAVSINLPIMRLVRKAMLPKADDGHLAEVLLGGMLYEKGDEGLESSTEVGYEFYDGVRELLLEGSPILNTIEVRLLVSEYLERHHGSSLDFRADLLGPGAGQERISETDRAFAHIGVSALHRLGGVYSRVAEGPKAALLSSKKAEYAALIAYSSRYQDWAKTLQANLELCFPLYDEHRGVFLTQATPDFSGSWADLVEVARDQSDGLILVLEPRTMKSQQIKEALEPLVTAEKNWARGFHVVVFEGSSFPSLFEGARFAEFRGNDDHGYRRAFGELLHGMFEREAPEGIIDLAGRIQIPDHTTATAVTQERSDLARALLPSPGTLQDFERLCCDLWKRIWDVPHAQIHGRSGQPQHGVDVFAPLDDGARWAGVQCKESRIGFSSKEEIEAEVAKARQFLPPLSEFVLATTAPNDGKTQRWAREITQAQLERGSFPVTIYGWDDICQELETHPDLVHRYYPEYSWPEPAAKAGSADVSLEAVRRAYLVNLYSELQSVSMTVFGGGSYRGNTLLQEVYIGLDVTSGFRLPAGSKHTAPRSDGFDESELETRGEQAPVSRRPLGPRFQAEADALIEAEKIPPLEKKPYGRHFSALEVAAASSRLVLIGPAGSGKSTFGRFLALCLAGEELGPPLIGLDHLNRDAASAAGLELLPELRSWPHGTSLPFFIELRKFVVHETFPEGNIPGAARHLEEFLVSRSNDRRFGSVLQRALDIENGVLLILDGLDETPAAEITRERLKEVIEGFSRARPHCRILVTSRPYAYDAKDWRLDGFDAETLAPFDEAKRRAFVRGWYQHLVSRGNVDEDQVDNRSADLIGRISQAEYLERLAKRPLMLTMITDLHASEGGRIFGGRAELYKRSLDLLLDRWNQIRHGIDVADYLGMSAESLRRALQRLAYEVHKKRGHAGEGEAAQITEAELWEALNRERPKEGRVDDQEVCEYLKNRSGILLGESPTTYKFPHRSYQEFMAACHLRTTGFPKLQVEELKADPLLWREVFLFTAGQAADLPYAVWGLLETLVPKAPKGHPEVDDPCFEHALCAALALEETGLWQRIEEHDESKLEKIRKWLQKALERGALSSVDRAAAGRVLGRLGDERKGVAFVRKGVPQIEWVEIPPGPFLMGDDKRQVTLSHGYQIGKYPVTNAQYRAFVADGGYTEAWRQCWTDEGWAWKTKEKREGPNDNVPESWLLPNHPRVAVTWYEAWAFSRWLGEKRGEPIFLPTEHQWERAARGSGGREYPWGDEPDASLMNIEDTGIGSPCAVGIFPKGESPEGVLDLSGNVWEWTANPWESEPNDELAERPADLAGSPGGGRVLRGGGFLDAADGARSAYRVVGGPRGEFGLEGFRVLLSSAPSEDG